MRSDEPTTSYELMQAFYRHEYSVEGYIERQKQICLDFAAAFGNPGLTEGEAYNKAIDAYQSMIKYYGQRAS